MANKLVYNSQYHDDWAWSLAIKGATNDDIAEAFGVSKRTIIRWTQEHESFSEALKEGKYIADTKIEKSLYQRAIGYTVEETEKVVETDKDGNVKPVKVRTLKKHIPPDTMAIMYWLNNRKRGEWTQKQEISLSSDKGQEVDVHIYVPDDHRDEE